MHVNPAYLNVLGFGCLVFCHIKQIPAISSDSLILAFSVLWVCLHSIMFHCTYEYWHRHGTQFTNSNYYWCWTICHQAKTICIILVQSDRFEHAIFSDNLYFAIENTHACRILIRMDISINNHACIAKYYTISLESWICSIIFVKYAHYIKPIDPYSFVQNTWNL